MFWKTESFRAVLNALMAEKTLSLIELIPQNPFARTLRDAVIDILRKGFKSRMDDTYLVQQFNLDERFIQLNHMAAALENLQKPPMFLVGAQWESIGNPFAIRHVEKLVSKAQDHLLKRYGQRIQFRQSRFSIRDWGIEDLSSTSSAPKDEQWHSPIYALIRSGNLNDFCKFLAANPNIANSKYGSDGSTLLHDLAAQGNETLPTHATMANELIKAGAKVNCCTSLGWTPIHIIAMQGQKEACELAKVLIAHGADLKATDYKGSDWRSYWQHGSEIRAVLENSE